MKTSLMTVADKVMLRKRAIIESVNDELKNIAQIEHSRHRSLTNLNNVSSYIELTLFIRRCTMSFDSVHS